MNKEVVIVSSGQPSANPRLVKEALALAEEGYKVKVIYCPLSQWADVYDLKLFKQSPKIEWIKAGYHPVHEKWKYIYARLRQKFYQIVYQLFDSKGKAAICSMVLYSQELRKEAKKHRADLYIGHNLGALQASVTAAKLHNTKAGFDFEDFHRGEDTEHSIHWEKTKQTEERYIPLLHFATAASPLITKAYQFLFPSLSIETVNNCFPLCYSIKELKSLPVRPLKLFWFSQFIGKKRGLETVIEAMSKINKGDVELSLLGSCKVEMKDYFQSFAIKSGLDIDQLNFIATVEEKEIVKIAATHHIGIGCEVPHVLNRELCLTNKVFIYLLAGNAIVFSRTRAQSLFFQKYPGIGVIYEQNNADELTSLLQQYIDKPELLQAHRSASLQLGTEQLNWEKEKVVFIQKVKEVFE